MSHNGTLNNLNLNKSTIDHKQSFKNSFKQSSKHFSSKYGRYKTETDVIKVFDKYENDTDEEYLLMIENND